MISLTQAEIDALLAERTKLIASIDKRQESIDNQDDVVQAATDADNAQKKVFDLYDVDIIGNYEDEREALNGQYIENPVLKSELDAVGQLDANNRMFPTNPITNPIRIAEFDDGGKVTTDNEIPGVPSDLASSTQIDHEPYRILKQAEREDWLVNGFGGTSPTVTGTMSVTEAITPATTTINIESSASTETFNFQAGDTFVVDDGSNQVGILVINVVSQSNGDPNAGSCSGETPPGSGVDETTCLANGGTWTPAPEPPGAELEILVLTIGSVTAGGSLDSSWAGFNNTDRTNKIDATDGYTSLLTDLIDDLENMIDARIAFLTTQETALQNNQDAGLDAQALIDVQDTLTFLNAWKVSKDVDDTELGTLSSERSTRTTEITARITAIETAMAGYYNARYTAATDVADTSRGTARIKFFRIDTQSVTGDLLAAEQARKQSIEDTLDLAGVPYT